jgi:hypothetical protein
MNQKKKIYRQMKELILSEKWQELDELARREGISLRIKITQKLLADLQEANNKDAEGVNCTAEIDSLLQFSFLHRQRYPPKSHRKIFPPLTFVR